LQNNQRFSTLESTSSIHETQLTTQHLAIEDNDRDITALQQLDQIIQSDLTDLTARVSYEEMVKLPLGAIVPWIPAANAASTNSSEYSAQLKSFPHGWVPCDGRLIVYGNCISLTI
jgi:hypothetical protein